jgi:hypothetical protein
VILNLQELYKLSGIHGCACEERHLLGCGTMWVLLELKCQRNMSPLSAGY